MIAVVGRHRLTTEPRLLYPAGTVVTLKRTPDRGTLIPNAGVQEFIEALAKAGQRAEYIQVGGAGHAFFEWKPDERTKATFAKYCVYCAAAMRTFFESVLY